MKSKELVKLCDKQPSCKKCLYRAVCYAYQIQFKCFPFDVKMDYKAPPEANSNMEIKFIEYYV